MSFWGGKNKRIRRCLFVLLIFITALFHHSGFIPKLFSVPAMALVPLCVCIAMNERSIPGLLYGLLCGALWDMGSAQADGYFCVALTAVGFLTGALSSFLVRNNIRACLLLSFGATTFCNVGYWLLFIVRKGYDGAMSVLINYYIPSILYTMVFAVIFYYITAFIVNKTKEKKKTLN